MEPSGPHFGAPGLKLGAFGSRFLASRQIACKKMLNSSDAFIPQSLRCKNPCKRTQLPPLQYPSLGCGGLAKRSQSASPSRHMNHDSELGGFPSLPPHRLLQTADAAPHATQMQPRCNQMQPLQDARSSFLISWGALGLISDFILDAKLHFL